MQALQQALRRGPFLIGLFIVAVTVASEGSSDAQSARLTSVPADQVIDHDYFAAGPVVQISGTINGDLYAAGGQVLIDGRVNGDVLVMGGRVMVAGPVAQSIRVAGGQVSLGGPVGRNVTVAGGNVEVTSAALIAGSVVAAGGNIHVAAPVGGGATIAAGSLILSNRVGGDVDAAVGSLWVSSTAEIRGRVSYLSRREASVAPGARIQGALTRRLPPVGMGPSPKHVVALLAGIVLALAAASFVSTLVLGWLSLRFVPTYHDAAVTILRERPWEALGVGLVAAVVTPVAGGILFATVLGIPLALLLMAVYLLMLYWGRIFAVHRLGEVICRLVRATPRPGWVFVVGLVLYSLLALIPIIGWLCVLWVVLSGVGAELMARKTVYMASRKEGII